MEVDFDDRLLDEVCDDADDDIWLGESRFTPGREEEDEEELEDTASID